ncbi:hypothetical protein FN846DRAFT_390048 [Sphaerosporella brunnea]|uniref:Fungal-type protein kinase domain-containing protein n=1 Tax=Sphaerosporella brunnea TaxID=1250544 RepID=A0A5J5EHK7_9PEZI|nr:hypothetical protein FN846DRAFT_390048 [Sphaerosporella brunnea]
MLRSSTSTRYGVGQSIPPSQALAWKEALRPLFRFVVENDAYQVRLDDDRSVLALAAALRESLLRIAQECEVDEPRSQRLAGTQHVLLVSPLHTLRRKELVVRDFVSMLVEYFHREGCLTLPFRMETLIRAVDIFLEPVPNVGSPARSLRATKMNAIAVGSMRVPMPFESLQSMKETQHSKVVTTRATELHGALWYTADDSFFDTFFPAVDDAPLASLVPPEQSKKDIKRWFCEYYELFQRSNAGRGQPAEHWAWNLCHTHVLGGTDKSEPTVDLFVTSEPAAKSISEPNWSDVLVPGQLRCREGLEDLSYAVVKEISNCAREIIRIQPGRRFVHAFTVINSEMRCWIFTAAGGLCSRSFSLQEPDGQDIFCRVFAGYMRMSRQDLGLDKHDPKATATPTPIGDHVFNIHSVLLWPAPGAFTRGTSCWLAEYASQPESAPVGPVAVKDSWHAPQHEHEAAMLADAQKAGVEGIADYVANDEVETIHQILGDTVLRAAIELDFDWRSKKLPSPYARASTAIELDSERRTKKRTSPCFGPSAKRVKGAAPLTITTTIPNHVHTRVVTSPGIPVDECESWLQVLLTIRDAVRGHHSLFTRASILHRHINVNTIKLTHPTCPRPDGFYGFLSDLEHARRLSDPACGTPAQTATYRFRSFESLEGNAGFVYTFYDDLLSFFYVFIALCAAEVATEWDSQYGPCGKFVIGIDQTSFERVLRHFPQDISETESRSLTIAVTEARKALWPTGRRFDRTLLESDVVREQMYAQFIRAFDKAAWIVDPDMALYRAEWARGHHGVEPAV